MAGKDPQTAAKLQAKMDRWVAKQRQKLAAYEAKQLQKIARMTQPVYSSGRDD